MAAGKLVRNGGKTMCVSCALWNCWHGADGCDVRGCECQRDGEA